MTTWKVSNLSRLSTPPTPLSMSSPCYADTHLGRSTRFRDGFESLKVRDDFWRDVEDLLFKDLCASRCRQRFGEMDLVACFPFLVSQHILVLVCSERGKDVSYSSRGHDEASGQGTTYPRTGSG